MDSSYEHIVIGVGGIGSAAAYWIAKRGGKNVLALEQYELGHWRALPKITPGSSGTLTTPRTTHR